MSLGRLAQPPPSLDTTLQDLTPWQSIKTISTHGDVTEPLKKSVSLRIVWPLQKLTANYKFTWFSEILNFL
jgi:hypothetical protein